MRREDVENWKGIQLKERAKNGKIRRDLRHWVLRWAYRYPEVMGHVRRVYRDCRKRRPLLRLEVTPGLKDWYDTPSNGGLSRDLAEDIARDEVAAGPAGNSVDAWRSWMRSREPAWRARGLPAAEVSYSVWSETESTWHLRHHPMVDPDRCAGCGEWMLDSPGMRLLDGAMIHFGNPDRLNCLILYGEAWRSTALAAL
jgi:hypothetical protein